MIFSMDDNKVVKGGPLNPITRLAYERKKVGNHAKLQKAEHLHAKSLAYLGSLATFFFWVLQVHLLGDRF